MRTLFFLFFYLLPKNGLSRLTGRIVSKNLGQWAVRWFQRHFKIDMNEAEHPIEHYKTIEQLFTRSLKKGTRPIGKDPVHPVDGDLVGLQKLVGNSLFQVKNITYSFSDLTQHQPDLFKNVLTYYLCPTDYHRVHSPVTGVIKGIVGVAGELWPVNEKSRKYVPRLFSRNERVVIEIETQTGPVLVVMVGATNVGKMSLRFDPQFQSNVARQPPLLKKDFNIPIQAGEELGVFHMGSTVIVAYSQDLKNIQGGKTKMGQSLSHHSQ